MKFRRGDVLWIRCDPSVGVEPRKTRTCVVISNDKANQHAAAITVVPTVEWTEERAARFYMVDLRRPGSTLPDRRLANCSMITTYDRNRIVKYAGAASPAALGAIEQAVQRHLGFLVDALEARDREVEYEIRARLPRTSDVAVTARRRQRQRPRTAR